MTLLNQSVQVNAQIPKFFETLRAGTAPTSFTRQFLKDIGFKSSNHIQFIPLLKGLGFLSSDGRPTERYRQFLDGSRWNKILAEAVREAYGDIFVIKAKPTSSDLKAISGKFKSTYNLSDTSADRCARTFLALLNLCDQDTLYSDPKIPLRSAENNEEPIAETQERVSEPKVNTQLKVKSQTVGLHYNIQIHLPATKDVEVYNAIFKSLKEHIIE
jgi:hypothetical protein